MDAASLLLGLLLGALLATAATLGVVALVSRRRPSATGLEPVHESLDHLHRLLTGMERARATAHGELREHLGTVGQASTQLKLETAALVTALRTPHVRGRWGEVQLRRVVEVAGLLEHCDFVEQPAGTSDDGAGVRPDLVVTLADGRQVIVDAKVPFTGYIEAVQAADEAVRAHRVAAHARQLRAHVDALAARRYPTAFRPAAPFTVLFVPSDGFLITALEAEPGLLEYGFSRDVVLATPSTLLALLRTVAYSWRQERLARDADQVLEVGRRLHARLTTLSGHLTRLGAALGTTMTRFNETVGSYERSVLTAARRFDDLGVGESPVPEPLPLEATVRALRPADPAGGCLADDREDDAEDDATTTPATARTADPRPGGPSPGMVSPPRSLHAMLRVSPAPDVTSARSPLVASSALLARGARARPASELRPV